MVIGEAGEVDAPAVTIGAELFGAAAVAGIDVAGGGDDCPHAAGAADIEACDVAGRNAWRGPAQQCRVMSTSAAGGNAWQAQLGAAGVMAAAGDDRRRDDIDQACSGVSSSARLG